MENEPTMHFPEGRRSSRPVVVENRFCAAAPSAPLLNFGGRNLSRTAGVMTRGALASCALILGCAALALASPQTTPVDDSEPTRQIDLAKLGYQGLSEEGRLMTTANVTVNFVDDNHVLFTFNPKKLFQRDPACPPSHKDRIIQAQVIDLGTGKVVHEASWYLHDEHRYLWTLGEGHFLLRKLNSLYVVDQDLHEKLLLESPKPLLWTGVTPDGKQI